MIGFDIKGIKISFDFGFFTVMALLFLVNPYGLAVSIICACIIHESGHIVTAVLCNVSIKEIGFRVGGIRIRTAGRINTFSGDMLILLSGPLLNILFSLVYYLNGNYAAFSVNIIMGAYNLLPFSGLDGGAILAEVLNHKGIFSTIVLKTGAVITALGIALLLYYTGRGSIMMYISLTFLVLSEFCY